MKYNLETIKFLIEEFDVLLNQVTERNPFTNGNTPVVDALRRKYWVMLCEMRYLESRTEPFPEPTTRVRLTHRATPTPTPIATDDATD